MKFHLALRDSTWRGDGAVSTNRDVLSYQITGMPPSDAAVIRKDPTTLRWVIQRLGGLSQETFDSPSAALASLQQAVDTVHLSR